jgi:hypothetical protein
MSNDAFPDTVKLPWSGDVTQAINPWSWMNNSLGQFGYININQTVSSNREMADGIAAVKAGYAAPTEENIERLVAGIRALGDRDPATYRAVVEKLRKRLPLGESRGG